MLCCLILYTLVVAVFLLSLKIQYVLPNITIIRQGNLPRYFFKFICDASSSSPFPVKKMINQLMIPAIDYIFELGRKNEIHRTARTS